jgi:hypothetical protein
MPDKRSPKIGRGKIRRENKRMGRMEDLDRYHPSYPSVLC